MASSPVASSDDKRALILEAALRVFAESGFHTSTVDKVAEVAGIAKGTVYLYFHSKNELMDELVSGRIARLTSLVEEATAQSVDELTGEAVLAALAGIVKAHFAFYSTERQFLTFLAGQIGMLGPNLSTAVLDGTQLLTARVETMLEQAMAMGKVRRATDARTMAFALMGMVHAVAYTWLMDPEPSSVDDISAEVFDMFMAGVRA
jgi:TetR/AcrR family fatty acid metabolism transcriptional regulator